MPRRNVENGHIARAWELGLLEKPTNRPGMGAGAAVKCCGVNLALYVHFTKQGGRPCPPDWLASETTAGAWEHRLLC